MEKGGDRADPKQMEILRSLTQASRVRLAARLWAEARTIKAAALRAFHPDWTEEEVQRAVREAFLRART